MSLNDINSTFSLYVPWPDLTGKLIYCCVVKVKSVSTVTVRYGTKVVFLYKVYGEKTLMLMENSPSTHSSSLLKKEKPSVEKLRK